jgi:hypothetical protein
MMYILLLYSIGFSTSSRGNESYSIMELTPRNLSVHIKALDEVMEGICDDEKTHKHPCSNYH